MTKKEKAHWAFISPEHYKNTKIQTISFIVARPRRAVGYLEGNVFKYLDRYEDKNGLQDLYKAKVYLEWLIEYKETGEITIK